MKHSEHQSKYPTIAALLVAAVLATGHGACSGCEEQDDETLIRSMVRHAVGLAEQHKLGDLMKLTTKELTVRPHGMTRQEVKGVLLMAFRRYGKFTIKHPQPPFLKIEPQPMGTVRSLQPHAVFRSIAFPADDGFLCQA